MDPSKLHDYELTAAHTSATAHCMQRYMTLRNANVDYRNANGRCWRDASVPELSCAEKPTIVPCLNKFDNSVGHVHKGEIVCFPLVACSSPTTLASTVSMMLEPTIQAGQLWCLLDCTVYRDTVNGWKSSGVGVSTGEQELLDAVAELPPPISASTVHSATECAWYGSNTPFASLYKFPHGAGLSTGLIGTLADNQCIDMLPGDQEKAVDPSKRVFEPHYAGFICAGHTSHSGEAGRIRRVTSDIRVRLLSANTTRQVSEMMMGIGSDAGELYTIFCMGAYCTATEPQVKNMLRNYRLLSRNNLPMFSMHVNTSKSVVTISISSGTLVKLASNGYWCDSTELHFSDKLVSSPKPQLLRQGTDQLRAYFSTFFSLHPYISSNRAPRPLISSVQLPQAVCQPWCPGTAAVSPCYSFDPIVTTPTYKAFMDESVIDDGGISSTLPGENVMILYLNLPLTYEDAIVVSKRYVDNGGFSTRSLVLYNSLPQHQYVPPVGSAVCAKLSPWWKSPCAPQCKHTENWILSAGRTYCIGKVPTARVHTRDVDSTGNVTVKVISYQQLQQGDKLSTFHGQKGTAVIVDYEDMPVVMTEDGPATPDVVMGMSSIVTRQTNGQLYETAVSLHAIQRKQQTPLVIRNGERYTGFKDYNVVNPRTGRLYLTALVDDSGVVTLEETLATFGIVRMLNQTQMSRERHQVSHLPVTKNTLRTPVGRAKGGGVAWGEMELYAMSSQGSQCSNEEIAKRGDWIVVPACPICQRLGIYCSSHKERIQVTIEYDLMVLDITNYICTSGTFKYAFAPEV